jgi:phosphohistidine phosphatase SixA
MSDAATIDRPHAASRRGFLRGVVLLVLATCFVAYGDEKKPTNTYTHYYVVRHAERQSQDDDADLSDAGRVRAQALADALANERIERIFVSDKKRTKATAAKTAEEFKVEPTAVAKKDTAGLIARLKEISGENVLVVRHHEELDGIVNELLRTATDKTATSSEEIKPVADTEYDDLFVVTKHEFLGKVSTHLERWKYGATSASKR